MDRTLSISHSPMAFASWLSGHGHRARSFPLAQATAKAIASALAGAGAAGQDSIGWANEIRLLDLYIHFLSFFFLGDRGLRTTGNVSYDALIN